MSVTHSSTIQSILDSIGTVVIGKSEVVRLTLTCLFAGGHVLFEDIPGIGKTILAKSMASVTNCQFNRIQFTPDMVPSDILGMSLYDLKSGQAQFKPGPIFADFILADEINRTTPRTQSALLEAMSENQVTIDGITHPLNNNFFVLATQNSLEYEGTFPLPEAQLDRFLMCLSIGYPSFSEELEIMAGGDRNQYLEAIKPLLDGDQISAIKQTVKATLISPELLEYALNLVNATRHHQRVELGISPRGSLNLVSAAKAYAFISGRNYCLPQDIQAVMKPVFIHRIIMKSHQHREVSQLLDQILFEVAVPIRTK